MSLLDAFLHALDLRMAEVSALPQGVQYWMSFMRALFISSALFAYWKLEARIVLLMALLTAVLLFGFKTALPEIHSGEIGQFIHVILWSTVLATLVGRRSTIVNEFRSRKPLSVVYGVWLTAVIATLTTSLIFDFSSIISSLWDGI